MNSYLIKALHLYEWSNAITIFLISAILTSMIIPVVLLISFRKKLFDVQDERKIHQGIISRLGGVTFKPVILFSIFLLLGINVLTGIKSILQSFDEHARIFFFGLCATLLLYLTGIVDDLIGVRYRTKFVIQITCGVLLAVSGLWINNLHGLFGIYSLSPIVGYPLTVLVVVFIINAINLIDGIDGLASGLSSIAMFYYGTFFMTHEQYAYAMLAFASLGTLIPFFCYNVFGDAGRGRKIFMGDAGSLTIGIILSILSISACTHQCEGNYSPFVIAFTPLLIPCLDVLRVVFHRFRTRKPLFMPDKNHIHHKLLNIGLSQHRALVIILTASAAIATLNIGFAPMININLLLLIDISIWTSLNIWLTLLIKRTEISNNYAD